MAKRDAQPKAAQSKPYRVRLNKERRDAFIARAQATGRTGKEGKNASRQEKGALLRSLGFSNKDIHDRNMRDWSGKRIEAAIAGRKGAYTQKQAKGKLSATEASRLAKLDSHLSTVRSNPTKSAKAMDMPLSRYEEFARWSGRGKGFPESYQQYIWRINEAGGHDKEGSYGYRVFYWQYVEGKTEQWAIDYVNNPDNAS